MKQKKKKKTASVKKVKKPNKRKVVKVATIANKVETIKKVDIAPSIVAKNVKTLDGITIERKERQYKFDERLVPYYLGGDTKEGNLALREALIKLGKTPEMTEIFIAMRTGNLGYREDAKEIFIKALYTIIKGHDEVGLVHVYEEDIQAIHDNNLKKFNEFWDAILKTKQDDDDLSGFSN